jgi:hypothetical protein
LPSFGFRKGSALHRKGHVEARKLFALPAAPPRDEGGRKCSVYAKECLEAAKEAELKNVRIGDLHLLRDY